MNTRISQPLLHAVALARHQFIQAASGLTYEQSQFKPSPDVWSVVDNVEHMVWAEMGGINGIGDRIVPGRETMR